MPPPLVVNGAAQTNAPFLSVNGGTSVPVKTPSLTQKIIGGIGQGINDFVGQFKSAAAPTVSGVASAITAPASPKANLLQNPYAPLQAGAKNIGDALNSAWSGITNAASTAQDSHASALQKGVAVGQAGMDALNVLFTPIMAPLAAVSTIPGIGYAADAVNNLFGAIGSLGSTATTQAVDNLPVSQQTKDQIRPLVSQVGALAAQLVIGKAGSDVLDKISNGSKEIISKIQADPQMADLAKPPPLKVNDITPKPIEQTQKPAEIAPTATEAPKITPDLQPLAQEAMKYKSAENLTVQQKGMQELSLKVANEHGVEITPNGDLTLYHGTQAGRAPKAGDEWRIGSYFTSDPKVAEQFANQGGRGKVQIMKVEVPPHTVFPSGDGTYYTLNEKIPVVDVSKTIALHESPQLKPFIEHIQAGKYKNVDDFLQQHFTKGEGDTWCI